MNILKIYKTQLTPARNALLDDIEAYLQAIENKSVISYKGKDALTYTENNFQFVKPDLDITIKINIPKNNNNLFDSIGNYARIEQSQNNGETSIWYYFITKSKWTAQSTLELQLSLDTVNTFSDYLLNTDNWSDKTSIIRQHKDRFIQIGLGSYVKSIDKIGEQISVPYSIKTNDINIEEPNSTGTPEWYLVYKTENPVISETSSQGEGVILPSENKINAFIYPKSKVVYSYTADPTPGEAFTQTIEDFPEGFIYGITRGGVSFTDVEVSAKYKDYIGFDDGKIFLNDFSDGGISVTISGSINVGDSFVRQGITYTCYAVAWYKYAPITGGENRMNLPIGLFKSNIDSKVYYAVNLTKYGDINIIGREFFFITRNITAANGNRISISFNAVPKSGEEKLNGYTIVRNQFQDTNTEADNNGSIWTILKPPYDTNWARNSLYVSQGAQFTFTASVNAIYAFPYKNITPSNGTLDNGIVVYENGSGTGIELKTIDTLVRDDPKLIKVVALPYCPTAITSVPTGDGSYQITFDTDVIEVYDGEDADYFNTLVYKNINASFGKDLNSTTFDFNSTDSLLDFYYNDNLTDKEQANETKLLHSDFYKPTFVYDNVNKVIRLEDISANDNYVNVTPWFQPTNTFSSTMLFKFNFDNADYAEITDWDRALISVRNNEVPIYNNEYLNYLRYGYGAEKTNLEESAEAQRMSAWTNAATGIAGNAVKLGTNIATGNVAGAISSGVGLVSSIASAAATINSVETSIANAQRSLAAKVDQLRNSAATVKSGNSAVDLMFNYTGNRLHLMTYDLVDILKDAVYDKFYYCGYSNPTQAKPNLNNRLVFNFVQCEPIFIDEATNTYNYYVEDIKERFRNGVTVYHDVSKYITKLKPGEILANYDELMYNWKQTYENWEIFNKVLPADFRIDTDDYNFEVVLNETLTNEYTSKFIPSADNTFRYKVTYRVPGSIIEVDYPYADATDRTNGYTLETNFSLNAISNIANGAQIKVKLIDTSGEWTDSEIKTITVNQYITPQNTPTVPYFKQKRVVSQGQTYWLWNSGSSVIATLNEFPIRGGDFYDVRILGTDYTMTLSSYKVAEINAYNN